MSKRTSALIGWSLVGVSLLLLLATLLIMVWIHQSPDDITSTALWFIPTIMMLGVGALIVSRQPDNRVGWISLATIAEPISTFADAYARAGLLRTPTALPAAEAMAWVASWLAPPTPNLFIPFLLLLFPDGRALSRRWRPIIWLITGWVTLLIVTMAFAPMEVTAGDLPYPNPLAIHGAIGTLLLLIQQGAWLLSPLVGLVTIVSLVLRFRRARGQERWQIKWLAYAAAILVADITLGILAQIVFPAASVDVASLFGEWLLLVAIAGLPVAIGIAIVSHRLYDIDVLINRTLIYTTMSATLALVYLSSVVSFQLVFRVLTGQTTDLTIVASTLTSAALFQPLRRRIQTTIDRRFYRHKYDAARVLAAFGTTIRDEVELNRLADHLVAVIGETMQPAQVSLWLRPSAGIVHASAHLIANGGD